MAGLVPAIYVFLGRVGFEGHDDAEPYGSPGLNGSSLPAGTLASETLRIIAIVT